LKKSNVSIGPAYETKPWQTVAAAPQSRCIDQMLATTLPLVTRMFLLVRVVEFASHPEISSTTRINSTSKHG
jgi:hypothetical protein